MRLPRKVLLDLMTIIVRIDTIFGLQIQEDRSLVCNSHGWARKFVNQGLAYDALLCHVSSWDQHHDSGKGGKFDSGGHRHDRVGNGRTYQTENGACCGNPIGLFFVKRLRQHCGHGLRGHTLIVINQMMGQL